VSKRKVSRKCRICGERFSSYRGVWCRACTQSFDRAESRASMFDEHEAAEWAAKRARLAAEKDADGGGS
jgi:hypothetical protein